MSHVINELEECMILICSFVALIKKQFPTLISQHVVLLYSELKKFQWQYVRLKIEWI